MSRTNRALMITYRNQACFAKMSVCGPQEEPKTACLIGFLVHETKDCYIIAKEWWETGQCKYLHLFPKKTAILEIMWLHPIKRDKGRR